MEINGNRYLTFFVREEYIHYKRGEKYRNIKISSTGVCTFDVFYHFFLMISTPKINRSYLVIANQRTNKQSTKKDK